MPSTSPKSTDEAAPARFTIRSFPASNALASGGAVVTFGVFNGVHRGHQEMLERLRQRAIEIRATPAVVVLRPRPAEALGLAPPRPYFTSLGETLELIRKAGIEAVGLIRFTRRLALAHPHGFLATLQARTHMRELWLGSRARIGRGPEGSIESARAFGAQSGFDVVSFEESDIWDEEARVKHLPESVLKLNQALGRQYELPCYAGPPMQGFVGGLAEYPLSLPRLLYLPPRGEYAVCVRQAHLEESDGQRRASPGIGALIVHASDQDRSMATLIGPQGLNWGDSFLMVRFSAARSLDAGRLLNWAEQAGAQPPAID